MIKVTIIGGDKNGETVELPDGRDVLWVPVKSEGKPPMEEMYRIFPFGNRFIAVHQFLASQDRYALYDMLIDNYKP